MSLTAPPRPAADRMGLAPQPADDPTGALPTPRIHRGWPLGAAWPVSALLLLYPLWWAAGLGVLIFPILAVPMVIAMIRERTQGRRLVTPPGFALWLIFLATLVVGLTALGSDPAGTVSSPASTRLLAAGFRIIEYVSLTVLLLYVGNRTPTELPQTRLVRLLAWAFGLTVLGGLLGIVAGRFAFTSPVELLLPGHIRSIPFVQSMTHPSAAQMMDILGHESPRPAAPWGYTNTWGNNFCLLVGWFVVAGWSGAQRTRTRIATGAVLAVAVLPVIYSLNRGLWIGLALVGGYVALRLASQGRMWALATLAAVAASLILAVVVTPLGQVVQDRLDHGKSNGVRWYLTERAVAGVAESPVIGFGSTRNTQGGRNSIVVGQRDNCARCGNFTVGGNGQLWQLLFAHGLVGTVGYLGFLGYGWWRFRRDHCAIGIAGSAALLGSFASMLWYNALLTPLAFVFLTYALLWRNQNRTVGVAQ